MTCGTIVSSVKNRRENLEKTQTYTHINTWYIIMILFDNVAETVINVENNKILSLPHTIYKVMYIQDSDGLKAYMWGKTVKYFKVNIGEYLFDFGIREKLLKPKSINIKEKIDICL